MPGPGPVRESTLALMAARSLLALLLLALTPVAATPQDTPPPFLLTLKGRAVYVNYTPGALDRASHIQQRLELLAVDFSKLVRQQLRLRVFVLSRDEWAEFGFGLPYGLPGRVRGTTMAVAAAGDAGTVQLWTDILGSPPPPLPGTPLKGTAEEASTLAMGDLMTQVEAARLLMSSGGIRGESIWVHQVLAHTVARMTFNRYERGRLGEIDAFFAMLGPEPGKYPLARYSQGLDLETLLWFEARFQHGAQVLMDGGRQKIGGRSVIKLARKNGGVLTEAALLDEHPQMKNWLETEFGEGAGSSEGPAGR